MTTEELDDSLGRDTTLCGDPKKWFPMRVTYQQEMKVKAELDRLGIENFLPMRYKVVESQNTRGADSRKDGDTELRRELVPAINNLIFVRSTQERVSELKRRNEVLEQLIEKIKERFEHRQASLPSRMTIGQTIFDSNLSTINFAGRVQHLSARQSEILAILAQHIGQTVERSYLLEHVWGNDSYANSLALNVQITYIRKLLEPDTSISIVSLKKRGYRLEVM